MLKFDRHQQQAIDNITSMRHKITVLCGAGGRGKSTIVNEIITKLIKDKHLDSLKIYVFAPTGKSALVVDAMIGTQLVHRPSTIHRGLGCQGSDWTYNENNRLDCEFLILEEASMIDSALLARVIRSISESAHILLSGDNAQLFPVQAGCPFNDIIEMGGDRVNRLEVNYRQRAGELLADVCELVLTGKKPDFSTHCKKKNAFHHVIDDKEEIPEKVLSIIKPWFENDDDWICLVPQRNGVIGLNAMNLYMQAKLNPPGQGKPELKIFDWFLRVGDRVRQTKNNYQLGHNGIFNGMVGTCIGVDSYSRSATIDFDGEQVQYDTDKNLQQLVLAYLITIHASQGAQFRKVCLIFHSSHYYMLSRSLLYVGVSRAKEELHIVGDKKGITRGISRNLRESRNTCLKIWR